MWDKIINFATLKTFAVVFHAAIGINKIIITNRV